MRCFLKLPYLFRLVFWFYALTFPVMAQSQQQADPIEEPPQNLAKCLADATDIDACLKANADLQPKEQFAAIVGLPVLESIDDDIEVVAIDVPVDDIVTPKVSKVNNQRFVAVDFKIQFDFDSARVSPGELQKLDKIARALRLPAASEKSFAVVGHTDSVGSNFYNCRLSLRRARTIVTTLVESGIDAARLQAIGAGEFFPVTENSEKDAANRRVGFITVDAENDAAISEFKALC